MKSSKKGFTLVEMMIVVAIIAVLAGVAIPQYNKYVKKSEAMEGVRLMKQIVDAQIIYESKNGEYKAFTATEQNASLEVLGVSIPKGAKFDEFTVTKCTGTVQGIIVSSSTGDTGAMKVYTIYPTGVTLTSKEYNKDYYEGSSYLKDYIDGEANNGFAPTCKTN
jgi:prepilin-type N-terminal cleavage/methylation domain-containing protein